MENNRNQYPHLGFDGNRVLNELTWQIENNPHLSSAEREWFAVIRTLIGQEFMSYEDAIQAAEMRNMRQPDFMGDSIGRWLDADERED